MRTSQTVRLHQQLVGRAEDALDVGRHVAGGEAEVLPRVVDLCPGHVQVPRHLGDELTALFRRDENGEVIDEPAVGQS